MKTFNLRERKRLTNQNGICLVFKNIIKFLVNIGNHLVFRKCSIAMPWLGITLFTRVNSFVEVLINMVCVINTSWFKKHSVKIPW